MSTSRISLGRGNKQVWPSEPCLPTDAVPTDLVGRTSEMQLVPTPRDALLHFALASSLGILERTSPEPGGDGEREATLRPTRRTADALAIGPEDLREAFERLFGDRAR